MKTKASLIVAALAAASAQSATIEVNFFEFVQDGWDVRINALVQNAGVSTAQWYFDDLLFGIVPGGTLGAISIGQALPSDFSPTQVFGIGEHALTLVVQDSETVEVGTYTIADPGPLPHVPDGGATITLLGAGIGALSLIRRRS
jgi:opacity protein-like surface antigen